MKWSYRFNPDMPFGREMIPSGEHHEPKSSKYEYYGKRVNVNFGFMELFGLIMVIPFWIFIYKFFYLLVLPIIPLSVVVFEMIRDVAPQNQLMMYGGSFLAAYLFYRGLKYLFHSFSFLEGVFIFIGLYILMAWGLYFLIEYYPHNEALSGTIMELEKVLAFIHSKI